jgi:endonuclease YncB( thermonuclease family)
MTKAWRGLILALLLVFPAIVPAFPQEGITGVASVIDGDTIEIHGQRIRGIDAPESSQPCVLPPAISTSGPATSICRLVGAGQRRNY